MRFSFFFFNDTATTEIYTLSLHDALPISLVRQEDQCAAQKRREMKALGRHRGTLAAQCLHFPDRKSTRLNSSHLGISYAVFCLKKKNTNDGESFGKNRAPCTGQANGHQRQ